ncbi:xylosidase glycosyl hydrolase [Fusarium sp. NRRL 52700]|nr:xylosidase glycosyl hydrolase [Fusarium sp. NRRL 52700]
MRAILGLLFSAAAALAEKFTNPVIWEDLSDVEVTRAGDAYFMTASTFHYSPGAPVLRSYDLVNWEHIGHSVPVLDWSSKYSLENGQRAYVKGIWASSLQYRESDGKFYFVACIEFGKTYVYSASSPTGPWSQIATINKCYYDAGLHFDTDNTPYVAFGRGDLHIAQLSKDMKTEVKEQVVLSPPSTLTLEGSRLYKKDNNWYIFLTRPATGQYIAKSTNGVFGTYDLRIIADNLKLATAPRAGAPHQGGLIDTPSGNWYYMSFVDMYPGGRAPALAPITWGSDGFPKITLVNGQWGDYDYPLPKRTVPSPIGTDTFTGPNLRADWEWNHNPDTKSFTVNNGLTLKTATVTKDLYQARNTLTHRIRGPQGTGTVLIDFSKMADGDRTGLAVLRDSSAWIGIEREGSSFNLVFNTGLSMNTDWTTKSTGTVSARQNNVSYRKIYLRVTANIAPGAAGSAVFSYSTDGNSFTNFGSTVSLGNDWQFFPGHRKNKHAFTHNDYTIGWVCALSKELTAATAMLDHQHPVLSKPRNDSNTYTLGSIGPHNIAITCLPKGMIGNIPAATVASNLVTTFPCIKVGLMVGIGGGVPSNKVRLGDVVVGTSSGDYPGVVKWDAGKIHGQGKFERTGSLNNPPQSLLTALTQLETQHNLVGNKIPDYLEELKQKWPKLAAASLRNESLKDVLFKSSYDHITGRTCSTDGEDGDESEDEGQDPCRFCDPSMIVKRKDRELRIHYGLIASGDKLIKDAASRNKLNKDLGGHVLCIEMEAAGLVNHFPCLVIRGICDYADSHKNKEWQEHAAIVAAAFAKELLQYVQPTDVEVERPLKDLLNNVHSLVSETREDVAEIRSYQSKEDDIKILDWLTKVDYGLQQSEFQRVQEPGTGRWLLDTSEYQNWLKTPGQTLFCRGMPGVGKTILTSGLISHLSSKFEGDSASGISYVFCNFQRQGQQTSDSLLACILKQLSAGLPSLPECLRSLYTSHSIPRTRPLSREILSSLGSVISEHKRVFVIIDALDEYGSAPGARESFLVQLARLQQEFDINLFATSRFDTTISSEIRSSFLNNKSLDINAVKDDIGTYIEGNFNMLPPDIRQNKDLRRDIVESVQKSVDGMFLLARIYLKLLSYKVSETEVRTQLAIFKRGSSKGNAKALSDAYEQTMTRIKSQEPDHAMLAKRVLLWLTYARSELTIEDLQYALATRSRYHMVSTQDLPFESTMISVCAGLVAFDESSRIIRLVHYTAQDYLIQSTRELFPLTEQDIARTCMAHLWISENERYRFLDFDMVTRHSYPLWWYSALNWGYHGRDSSISTHELLAFLDDEATVSLAMRNALQRFSVGYFFMRHLHVAAYFGLAELTETLLEMGATVDSADRTGRTPLSYAAEQGHEAIMVMLLERGAKVDSQDGEVVPKWHYHNENAGRTPLSFAAEKGHEAAAHILIANGASSSIKSRSGLTPLSYAVENRRESLIRLFLDREPAGISIELGRAVDIGHDSIVRLLLENGAEVDYSLTPGLTPLFRATRAKNIDIVQLLLENGANPDPVHHMSTPLLSAAVRGYDAIVRVLLETGRVEIDRPDRFGRTSLSHMAQHGYKATVKTLLDMGAEPNTEAKATFIGAQFYNGRTPLSFAAEKGHEAIVELLITKGATVGLRPTSEAKSTGSAPISYAARNGHEGVIRALVETGQTAPDSPDYNGRTPLSYAAEKGLTSVVRLLLEKYKADPDHMDEDGHTPLSYAAQMGHSSVVRELLETGKIGLDSVDDWGLTPLCHAALWGHKFVALLLVANGADVDYIIPSGDWKGKSAVEIATIYEHQAVVDILDKRLQHL